MSRGAILEPSRGHVGLTWDQLEPTMAKLEPTCAKFTSRSPLGSLLGHLGVDLNEKVPQHVPKRVPKGGLNCTFGCFLAPFPNMWPSGTHVPPLFGFWVVLDDFLIDFWFIFLYFSFGFWLVFCIYVHEHISKFS